jgi:hypothetical protein
MHCGRRLCGAQHSRQCGESVRGGLHLSNPLLWALLLCSCCLACKQVSCPGNARLAVTVCCCLTQLSPHFVKVRMTVLTLGVRSNSTELTRGAEGMLVQSTL